MPSTLDIAPSSTVNRAQRDFFADITSQHPAYVGGFGCGKTLAGCWKAVASAARCIGQDGIMVAPTYDMMDKILVPTLIEEVLQPLGLWADCKFKKGPPPKLEWPWGGRIYFYTADKPQRLVAVNAAWGYIDELQLCKELAWKNAAARIRIDPADGSARQLFATFTPEVPGFTHEKWGRLELYGEDLPEGYQVYQPEFDDRWERAGRHPYNNRLSLAFFQTQRAEWGEEEAKARVDGRFAGVQYGRAYHAYSRENLTETATYTATEPLWVTFDFNSIPGMHVELAQEHGDDVWVVDEVYQRGLTLEGACETVLKRYAGRHTEAVYICGDSTGTASASKRSYFHIISDIFRNGSTAGMPFMGRVVSRVKTNPGVEDRVNNVNRLCCDANGLRRLKISPKCKCLKADLESLLTVGARAELEARTASGPNRNHPDKSNSKLSHASDALGYMLYLIDPPRTRFQRYNEYKVDVSGRLA